MELEIQQYEKAKAVREEQLDRLTQICQEQAVSLVSKLQDWSFLPVVTWVSQLRVTSRGQQRTMKQHAWINAVNHIKDVKIDPISSFH